MDSHSVKIIIGHSIEDGLLLDDRYQILVASDLEEESPHSRLMKEFHGELILLPISEQYYPRIDAIQWHRKNVFTLKSQGSSRK